MRKVQSISFHDLSGFSNQKTTMLEELPREQIWRSFILFCCHLRDHFGLLSEIFSSLFGKLGHLSRRSYKSEGNKDAAVQVDDTSACDVKCCEQVTHIDSDDSGAIVVRCQVQVGVGDGLLYVLAD